MILDKDTMFSYQQAVTATGIAESIVDMGPGDTGPSELPSLFVTCDPPFTGAGTLSIDLQTADAVGADGSLISPVTVASFPVTNAALLAGGKLVAARLPHGCKRYLGLNYTVSGSVAAGTITAGLVWDVQADSLIL